MKLYDAIIGIVEKHIAPIAAKVGNQPHVRAMRTDLLWQCRLLLSAVLS